MSDFLDALFFGAASVGMPTRRRRRAKTPLPAPPIVAMMGAPGARWRKAQSGWQRWSYYSGAWVTDGDPPPELLMLAEGSAVGQQWIERPTGTWSQTDLDPSQPLPDSAPTVVITAVSLGHGSPTRFFPMAWGVMWFIGMLMFFLTLRLVSVVLRTLEEAILIPWLFTKPTGVVHVNLLIVLLVSCLAGAAGYAVTVARREQA